MDMNLFMDKLLEAAKAAGIETAEVLYTGAESFRAGAMDGEINTYQVSSSCGLSLRGSVAGKMGYASTQAFDDQAIEQLIEGVKESAALVEAEEQDEIFAGEAEYPVIEKMPTDLDSVTPEQKLAFCLAMEKAALAADPRIVKVPHCMVMTSKGETVLRNSYGLKLHDSGSLCMAVAAPVARDGESVGDSGAFVCAHSFGDMNAQELAEKAVAESIGQLHGSSVPTGEYRVILRRDAMASLLSTFSGVFSAENAQQNLSLLGGKEGTRIASDVVTLMDDPLLPGGLATCAFDSEGSASRTKAVIDKGVLTTLLHSRKTARKQGTVSTGNAQRARYSSPVHVAPTNFFFQPGEKDLAGLMQDVGEGLVITDLAGLHSGANTTSGDFSLLSKGYTIQDGQRGRAVEQVTIAGNFYELLKNIRAIGSDLEFPGSSTGSSSVDVGLLKVSGT